MSALGSARIFQSFLPSCVAQYEGFLVTCPACVSQYASFLHSLFYAHLLLRKVATSSGASVEGKCCESVHTSERHGGRSP
eukprot:4625149-Amphidinium_carterae.1